MPTTVTSFADCISALEKKRRFSVVLVNFIIWLAIILWVGFTFGSVLIFFVPFWILNYLAAEYNARKIQALGVTVSDQNFPEVYVAASEVATRFGVGTLPRIVVIRSGEANALAIAFARKNVIVLLSSLLNDVIDDPAQLRALVAHEMCHTVLDHGSRRYFEIYKPAAFRSARELTCDNAGLVAANSLSKTKVLLHHLAVSPKLAPYVTEQAMIEEAAFLNSGFYGWLLRNYLSHPPIGARLKNLNESAGEFGVGA